MSSFTRQWMRILASIVQQYRITRDFSQHFSLHMFSLAMLNAYLAPVKVTVGPPTARRASGAAQLGLRRGIRQALGCSWEPGTGCPHDLQPPFRHRMPLAWCGHPVLEGMEGVLALELVKLAVRPRSHSRVRIGVDNGVWEKQGKREKCRVISGSVS